MGIKKRKNYSDEFKKDGIGLAKDIGIRECP